jgi:hypothetical protein
MPTSTVWRLTLAAAAAVVVAAATSPLTLDTPPACPATGSGQVCPAGATHPEAAARTLKPQGRRWG